MLPVFMKKNPPSPDPAISNIFVFHAAVDLPSVNPPYIEAEITPKLMPEGFDYYAAGHIHKRFTGRFKAGILAYSGCTETVSYDEAELKKGFFHVKVSDKCKFSQEFVELTSPRRFTVLEHEFSGMTSEKITETAIQLVRGADEEGTVIIPVLKGVLPAEASRAEIDIARLRGVAEKALLVRPVVLLKESAVSDDIVRSIFESEFKDLKTKTFEYFLQIFSERYSREEAEKIASSAIALIEPLTKKKEEKVKQAIEELLQ
jgi:DNA repair exonuclease SbcCD nuclease subunit